MAKAASYVDYQQRAKEFKPGDAVYPFIGGNAHLSGRVVAVWPSIGMVDVEWPHGNERLPVEDLQRHNSTAQEPVTDNVPGGNSQRKASRRVAEAYVKKALYWASVDRKYRASKAELDSGNYDCPRCKQATLRKAVYKRQEGSSERLYGCPNCMFLIKACDIIGSDAWDAQGVPAVEDCPDVVVASSDKEDYKEADWDGTMNQGFNSVRDLAKGKKKAKDKLEDACWEGYEAIGTKKQDGKEVPNCVPKKKASDSLRELQRLASPGGLVRAQVRVILEEWSRYRDPMGYEPKEELVDLAKWLQRQASFQRSGAQRVSVLGDTRKGQLLFRFHVREDNFGLAVDEVEALIAKAALRDPSWDSLIYYGGAKPEIVGEVL